MPCTSRWFAPSLTENPDLCLRLDSAREFGNVQELVDNGFLAVTGQYLRWVERYGR